MSGISEPCTTIFLSVKWINFHFSYTKSRPGFPVPSQFAKRPDSDVTWRACYGSSCLRDCQ